MKLPVLGLGLLAMAAGLAEAGDQPQWGERWSRNLVSGERPLAASFDPETGRNVRWSVPLGTRSYGTPVVARGRVFVGTNNARPRDPRHRGDRNVLFCLRESDGELLWQLIIPKLRVPMADFTGVGVCSPPSVEGDRVYLFTNRGEVLCLDIEGQANGNDGPYRDEGAYMVPKGSEPTEVGKLDADILWRCDVLGDVRMRLHDAAHCSVMVHGDFVYSGTCNGVDQTHFKLPRPEAPSLVAVAKATGRLVATDAAAIGPQLIHCMWSSPSLGTVAGRERMFFGGGDGVCYAFEPLRAAPPEGQRAKLKVAWRFHCDPAGRKERPLDFQDNRQEGPSLISGMPVFYRGRVYVTAGGDVWHGKPHSWLKCIDAGGTGDITVTGELWSRPLKRHSMATPAVHDGLVYITDSGGQIHCFDAVTGRPVWVHETRREIWSSPLVADGKVYVGAMGRHLFVLAADRRKRLLADVRLDSPMATSPVAANATLYIATMRTLYAVAETKR